MKNLVLLFFFAMVFVACDRSEDPIVPTQDDTQIDFRAQTYNATWKQYGSPDPYLEIYYGDKTMDSVFFYLIVKVWDGSFYQIECCSQVVRFPRQLGDRYVIDGSSLFDDCINFEGICSSTGYYADEVWNNDPNDDDDGLIQVGAAYYKNGNYGGQWTYLDEDDCVYCEEVSH